jgi:hypothetical protein
MWQAAPSLPHGIGRHPPLQYVPAPHETLQPPQLNGSLEGFTHLPWQQVRPTPHDASHPLPLLAPLPPPLLLPVLPPLPVPVLPPLPLPVLPPLLLPVLPPVPLPVLVPVLPPLPPLLTVPLLPPEPLLPLAVDASVEASMSGANTAPPQSGIAATNAASANDQPTNPTSERMRTSPGFQGSR